jgi:hypothetical protein
MFAALLYPIGLGGYLSKKLYEIYFLWGFWWDSNPSFWLFLPSLIYSLKHLINLSLQIKRLLNNIKINWISKKVQPDSQLCDWFLNLNFFDWFERFSVILFSSVALTAKSKVSEFCFEVGSNPPNFYFSECLFSNFFFFLISLNENFQLNHLRASAMTEL